MEAAKIYLRALNTKHMKRGFLLILTLALFLSSDAQYRWDWGVHLGAANYLGDIGGKDDPRRDFVYDIKLDQTSYVFGGHIRYKTSRNVSIAGNFRYGKVQGWDEDTEYAPRRARNLNFRNNLKELSVRGEYTLYTDNDLGGKGYYNPDFKVFAFIGVAGLMHNPKAYLGENQYGIDEGWYELRDLKTEGQSKKYSSFTYSIPLGVGVSVTHQKKYRFGWELSYSLSGTDYLDDISTTYAYNSELDSDLARALANQTNAEVIAEVFGDPSEIYNYHYQGDSPSDAQGRNQRGIETNNDGYVFSTFSAGMLIRDRSRFSKAKYNFYKHRKRRRTRAKF
jgi:hypothetical protein